VLLGLALFVALRPASDDAILKWVAENAGVVILGGFASAFAVAQVFLMFQILRQQGRILVHLDEIQTGGTVGKSASTPASRIGLPVGAPAPAFRLPTLAGTEAGLPDLLDSDKSLILVFVHPGCGPCSTLLPEIAHWQSDGADGPRVIVVSEGKPEENRLIFASHQSELVLLQKGHEVSDSFRAYGTPAAVVVGADGRIASSIAAGAEGIRVLVKEAISHSATSRGMRHGMLGAIAPEFSARTVRSD